MNDRPLRAIPPPTEQPEPVEYTCSRCGGEFYEGRSNEEAVAEMNALWPREVAAGVPMDIVCDDCFNDIMRSLQR